jgi:hypothetical protein
VPSSRALFVAAFVLLVIVRLPSMAQPAGADQGLYTYIAQRILHGEQPYRDAWDQKPPGVHFLYAGLWRVWPHESVVPAADLGAAALTAAMLVPLGRALAGSRAAGWTAALLFLFLGNPSLTRLGGVRIRAQAEVFIALLVTAAMLVLAWHRLRASEGAVTHPRASTGFVIVAGVLLGLAIVLKYNAAAYAAPLALLVAMPSDTVTTPIPRSTMADAARGALLLAIGAIIPVAAMLAHFWYYHAFEDFWLATVTYNLQYSGETYTGPVQALRYLLTFPIRYARVDPLWFLGGGACAVLLVAGWRRRSLWVPPVWVAAACASIAINGSRGLPQYFVQAGPALAIAAAGAGALVFPRLGRGLRLVLVLLLAVAVWRVGDFRRGVDYTLYDLGGLTGRLDRDMYLSRYGRADSGDKYSALAVHDLARLIAARTSPTDQVFVFGFSPWAYVGSNRPSASRFFWSLPVILGFEAERPGYGWRGMLDELRANRPALVALQRRDWDPYSNNSDVYFRSRPELNEWLTSHYTRGADLHNFEIWIRSSP